MLHFKNRPSSSEAEEHFLQGFIMNDKGFNAVVNLAYL